jgi:hypothetical protein
MQVKTAPRAVGSKTEVNRTIRGTEPSTEDPPSLTPEEIFQLLSNRRRRYALHYLDQVDDPVSIRDLSEQIAAWEYEIDRADVTPTIRKRIYTALHQGHLPKMDRLGVIDYDNDRGTVCPAERVRDFDIYLDVVPHNDIPWDEFVLGLGATMFALVVVSWLGIPPFGAIGGFFYASLASLSILVMGGYRMVTDTKERIGRTGGPAEITPPEEVGFGK